MSKENVVSNGLSPLRLSADTTKSLGDALKRFFGFDKFRVHQLAATARVAVGGNLLVVLPTGSGKSLLFQLPVLARTLFDPECISLVISP
jgi:ATP-dependent DNA helicase RecQ